ncbi:MAG: RES family NAD+ phosphorylase [Solirubrobacterales bacterium]|nr:RES family NAD+ phosphorylase [Solirubrobacterales bacterium]
MGAHIRRVPVSGTWVRHVPAGGRALGTGRRGTAGRFHRPGEIALYLADSMETAWAEWYRALAERGRSPADDLPRDVYRISVRLRDVVDVSAAAGRKGLGLPAQMRPAASQRPAFQELAATLRAEEAQGVLYRSAARSRAPCLCVFEPGLSMLRIEGEPMRVLSRPPPPRGLRT